MGVYDRLTAARERVRKWWREDDAPRPEKKPAAPPDPPEVTVPEWLVRAAHFASWVAMACLVYFLGLYCLDIARDRAGELHITHAGTWVGELQFWFPYVIGFAVISFGIPYVAKIAIPTFMSLSWREHAWPKVWALFIAVCVSLVVISGTFAVQGHTLMERDRESAVAVEGVGNARAAMQAEIDGITADLNTAMNNPNRIMAQAASVGVLGGAEEWERSYVAQARATNDPRLPLLERATGAARAAKAASDRRAELRRQLAVAPTVASVQGEVVTARTSWIADTLGWLEGMRALLLSFVMDIVALMMPWIALRLEQARNRQLGLRTSVAASGWADESHRIEDLRGKAIFDSFGNPKKTEPLTPYTEKVMDAETGEELVKVRPREYWRRRGARKGKPTKVDIVPDIPPDEVGVNAYATGRVELPNGEGVMVTDAPEPAEEPPMSDDEAAALLEAVEPPVDGTDADQQDDSGDEPDAKSYEREHAEPQTDVRRLIAAE